MLARCEELRPQIGCRIGIYNKDYTCEALSVSLSCHGFLGGLVCSLGSAKTQAGSEIVSETGSEIASQIVYQKPALIPRLALYRCPITC